MKKPWIMLGASLAGLAVALGAFGAHALREQLSDRMLSVYQTGVDYHFVHALGLILFGLASDRPHHPKNRLTGWAFLIGCFLFSGSLYALAMTEIRVFGAITPLGGLAFLIGWFYWGWKEWSHP